MFTKDGGWSFFKAHDAILQRLSPKERFVYLELARIRVRKNQHRTVSWEGRMLELREFQLRATVRGLAASLDLGQTVLWRVLRQLEWRGVIRTVRRSRHPDGGLLLEVLEPDSIADLRGMRAARLEQLMRDARADKDAGKTVYWKERWNRLKQSWEQLIGSLKDRNQSAFEFDDASPGTASGTLEVFNPRSSVLESAGKALETASSVHGDTSAALFAIRKAIKSDINGALPDTDKSLENQGDESMRDCEADEKRRVFDLQFRNEKERAAKLREIILAYRGYASWVRRRPDDFEGSPSKSAMAAWPPNLDSPLNHALAVHLWYEHDCFHEDGKPAPRGATLDIESPEETLKAVLRDREAMGKGEGAPDG